MSHAERAFWRRRIFITSSVREILPIVKLDERLVGDGRPGSMVRQLLASYRELVQEKSRARTPIFRAVKTRRSIVWFTHQPLAVLSVFVSGANSGVCSGWDWGVGLSTLRTGILSLP